MDEAHQTEERQPEQKRDGFLMQAARYTAIATSLPGAVIAGYVIGYALDRWLGTTYLTIVFLLLGIVAGFVELIRLILRDMRK